MMADDTPQPSLPFEGPPLVEGPVTVQASQLWSWTDLAMFLAFAALAFLAANLLIAFGYVALRDLAGRHATSPQGQADPLFSLFIEVVWYTLLVGFVYFLVVGYHGRPFWSSLKLRRPSVGETVSYTIGGFLMAVGVQLAPTLLPDTQEFPLEKMLNTPLAAYALGGFAILVAPFMEELIFRGVIFAVLERRVHLVFAMVTTALLFGALHVPEYAGAWNHVLLIFMVGGVFSLTRGLTGSLTPGVILHVAYNFS